MKKVLFLMSLLGIWVASALYANDLENMPQQDVAKENEVVGKITGFISEDDPPILEVKFFMGDKEIAKEHWSSEITDPARADFPEPKLVYKEGELPDGLIKIYAPTGELVREVHYRNNKLNGMVRDYYENGEVAVESNYQDYQVHGVMKFYRKDSDLHMELTYQNNKVISWKTNLADGTIMEHFFKNNQLCYKTYDKSGNIIEEEVCGQ